MSAASTPVLTAIKKVFASLYNDRAIAYRVHHRVRARGRSRCRPVCSGWSDPTLARLG